MKRIILFIATNLAVMVVLSIVLSLLGIGRPGSGSTLQLGSLLAATGFAHAADPDFDHLQPLERAADLV